MTYFVFDSRLIKALLYSFFSQNYLNCVIPKSIINTNILLIPVIYSLDPSSFQSGVLSHLN